MKRCRACCASKPLDQFRRSGNTSDGREGKCRACRAAADQQRREARAQARKGAIIPARKRCTKCDQEKPLAEFNRKGSEPDGFCSWCRECHALLPCRARTARQAQKRKEAEAEGRRYRTGEQVRYQADLRRLEEIIYRQVCHELRTARIARRAAAPAFRCKSCERRKPRIAFYEADLTGLARPVCSACRREQYRARYEADPSAERLRTRRYKHAHPDRVRHQNARRYRRMAQRSDGTLTSSAVEMLYSAARACPYCARPLTSDSATLDHLDPVGRGGLHGISNTTACCGPCNSAKGDRPYSEWLKILEEPHRSRALRLYRRVRGHDPHQPSLPFEFREAS